MGHPKWRKNRAPSRALDSRWLGWAAGERAAAAQQRSARLCIFPKVFWAQSVEKNPRRRILNYGTTSKVSLHLWRHKLPKIKARKWRFKKPYLQMRAMRASRKCEGKTQNSLNAVLVNLKEVKYPSLFLPEFCKHVTRLNLSKQKQKQARKLPEAEVESTLNPRSKPARVFSPIFKFKTCGYPTGFSADFFSENTHFKLNFETFFPKKTH